MLISPSEVRHDPGGFFRRSLSRLVGERQPAVHPKRFQHAAEVRCAPETQYALDSGGVVNPPDTSRQPPAMSRVKPGRVREVALDDVGGCALQRLSVGTNEWSRGRQDKDLKPKRRGTVERHDMCVGRILDREPPVEKFVSLQIGPRQLTLGIVLFRKKASGAKYQAVQPVFEEVEAAKPLGGELGHPVDVPRRERPQGMARLS